MAHSRNSEWLEKMKARLVHDNEQLAKQVIELKKDDPFSDPSYVDDNAAVDTDVREQDAHQTIQAEIEDLQDRAKNIDFALKQIEKGRYGYCAKCGKEIPEARLDIIPEAQYCIDCEKQMRK